MEKEKKLQIQVFIKLLIVFICAGLYAWGGIESKWLRRFLAPGICCLSMFYFSKWDWRSLAQMPLMFLTLSFGYGAFAVWLKIVKRALFGIANGFSGSTYTLTNREWLLSGIHIFLLSFIYIVVGVWNPFPSARIEETFLGVMVFLIPVFSAKGRV